MPVARKMPAKFVPVSMSETEVRPLAHAPANSE
jgi:hypothetical protein